MKAISVMPVLLAIAAIVGCGFGKASPPVSERVIIPDIADLIAGLETPPLAAAKPSVKRPETPGDEASREDLITEAKCQQWIQRGRLRLQHILLQDRAAYLHQLLGLLDGCERDYVSQLGSGPLYGGSFAARQLEVFNRVRKRIESDLAAAERQLHNLAEGPGRENVPATRPSAANPANLACQQPAKEKTP